METVKSIIYLKSWAKIDSIETAEFIRDHKNAWAPNDFINIKAMLFLSSWEMKVCNTDIIRWEIVWVIDLENGILQEIPQPPQPEEAKLPEWVELEPRQKMTRDEMDKIYEDRTWKKPHHKKSNKQVRELLNSLPEDIDADNL